MNKARDEAVWFAPLCAGLALAGANAEPSTGTYLIALLLICWAFWSVYVVLMDRM